MSVPRGKDKNNYIPRNDVFVFHQTLPTESNFPNFYRPFGKRMGTRLVMGGRLIVILPIEILVIFRAVNGR